MNCEQAEELLGAYAVDALPDDEAVQFRAHIATCAAHAEKAAEMRAFAASLALSIEPASPPVALRARVLDAIAREPQLSAAGDSKQQTANSNVGNSKQQTANSKVSSLDGRRGRIQWIPNLRPMQAWGALAAAVIAGLLAWNVVLQTGGESEAERYAVTKADAISALVADGAPVGTVLYFEDERKAVVIADGVPQLDASQTYQMWAIAGGVPASIGLMAPDADGRTHSIVPFDASRADTFAVTIEPAGGSDQPTTDPVYTATIRS